jgi:glycosyltransferase involved in cell wall biosynthesis
VEPKVSIGVASYNRPDSLKVLLDSLISQTYRNIQIIVSDNCSSNPKIRELLVSYAESNIYIEYYIQDENIGPTSNFLFLKCKAKGQYFMWAADDDWYDYNYVESCMKLHMKSKYVLVSGLGKYYNQENNLISSDLYFKLNSKYAFIRCCSYFYNIKRNSIFYGVYDISVLNDLYFENYVSADLTFISQLCMLGPIERCLDASQNISMNGATENRQKMVKFMGYKGVKVFFFELLVSFNATYNIFKHPKLQRYNFVIKIVYSFAFFLLHLLNQFFNSIGRRLPKLFFL